MKLFCRKDLGPHPHEHSAISELPDWSYAGKRKNLFTYTLLVHVLSTSVKRLFWLSDGRHAPLTPGTLKKRLEMEEFTVSSAGRVTVLQHQIKNTLFFQKQAVGLMKEMEAARDLHRKSLEDARALQERVERSKFKSKTTQEPHVLKR